MKKILILAMIAIAFSFSSCTTIKCSCTVDGKCSRPEKESLTDSFVSQKQIVKPVAQTSVIRRDSTWLHPAAR